MTTALVPYPETPLFWTIVCALMIYDRRYCKRNGGQPFTANEFITAILRRPGR